MLPIENKPSDFPPLNPVINLEENPLYIISDKLAQISAAFSRLMTWGSDKPVIAKDISNKPQEIKISIERELELTTLVNCVVDSCDNLVNLRNFGKLFSQYEYFVGINRVLEKIKEEENEFLWEKDPILIKKIVFSNTKHFSEEKRGGYLALDMFFTKFQKKALYEEAIKHINLILALNSNEMPKLPSDIKNYIFSFTRALLEKQEPECAEAFYPAAAYYLREEDISDITDISNMIEYTYRIKNSDGYKLDQAFINLQ